MALLKLPNTPAVWDREARRNTTYFSRFYAPVIQAYVQSKTHGENLDLGGGWTHRQPAPGPVVDFSLESLRRNPNPNKVLFDLEDIARGAQLPFRGRSFDSATMLSVYQYLDHREAIIREIGRVLRRGAPLILINFEADPNKYADGGYPEYFRLRPTPDEFRRDLLSFGYEAAIEPLAVPNSWYPVFCATIRPNAFRNHINRTIHTLTHGTSR